MFGVLPPSAYGSSAAHELERAAVFERAWLCVGLTDELATHHQFLVRQLADTSVVVQNFSGQLKAFVNVCSHRVMRSPSLCARSIYPPGAGGCCRTASFALTSARKLPSISSQASEPFSATAGS